MRVMLRALRCWDDASELAHVPAWSRPLPPSGLWQGENPQHNHWTLCAVTTEEGLANRRQRRFVGAVHMVMAGWR